MNNIELFLKVTKSVNNGYHYRYVCRMDNGVEVNLEGLIISQATQITVQLTEITNHNFEIAECLIPCDQNTISAHIRDNSENKQRVITVTDLNNEKEPHDYNFIVIVKDRQTQEQVICDPQVRNKGTINT